MMTATRVRPCRFNLDGKLAPGWAMARPLPITLEQGEDGTFTTQDELFTVRGKGETAIEALRDYMAKLVDYYKTLEARATQGDEPVRTQLHRLQDYVQAAAR